MKILKLEVMSGPNIWSNYRQRLIVMQLDLQEMEKRPTHRIPGFPERIKTLMPSLYGHRCSEANKGGFFQRVEQGTWMGHVIEHIALEIQTLAGMDCGYGRTRSTDKEGVYNVVFAYRVREAGLYAAKAAVSIAHALIDGAPYDLQKDIAQLREIASKNNPAATALVLVEEAHRAEIPYHLIGDKLIVLGYGVNQVKLRPDLSGTGSGIGLGIARSRYETANLLSHSQIILNQTHELETPADLEGLFAQSGEPLVIRPAHGDHHRRVCLPVSDLSAASSLFELYHSLYRDLVAEPFVAGDLYRVLIIDYKIEAVLRCTRTHYCGDGRTTLSALVRRQLSSGDAEFVPPIGQLVVAEELEELWSGDIHRSTVLLCERTARSIDLNVCAVDIICHDLAQPLTSGKLISIDPTPNFQPFLRPATGEGLNVIKPLFSMLFPDNNRGRIPVIAARGEGETEPLLHLLAHIIESQGKRVGVAAGSGIYLSGCRMSERDASEHSAVRGLLTDPGIEAAIVHCTTPSILGAGLAFDGSELSIITGHRPMRERANRDQEDIERKADLVVGRTTFENGYVILNADNGAADIEREIDATVTYYTIDKNNPIVRRHCGRGGKAVIYHDGSIYVAEGRWRTLVCEPETTQKAASQLGWILPAVLSAWLLGVDTPAIAKALGKFENHEKTVPATA